MTSTEEDSTKTDTFEFLQKETLPMSYIESETLEAYSSTNVELSLDEGTELTARRKLKKPRILKPIKPQIIAYDDVCILEAQVDSYPTCTFQWYHEQNPLTSTISKKVVNDNNTSTLILNGVNFNDSGNYTCRAENILGSAVCSAIVSVIPVTEWDKAQELKAPHFSVKLQPQKVMDGEQVTLLCNVDGHPIPHVQWLHSNRPVIENNVIHTVHTSRGLCKLSILEAFPEDAGVYTCKATNRIGEDSTSTMLEIEPYEYVHIPSDEEVPKKSAPKIIKKLPKKIVASSDDVIKYVKKTYSSFHREFCVL